MHLGFVRSVSGKKRRFSRDSLETITSERLEAIVEAAEQAAAKVIDEAEDEARRHLKSARAEAEAAYTERISPLAGATDSLIAQTEDIRRRSDRLLEALEEVRAQLAGDAGRELLDAEAAARPSPRSHLSAVAPAQEPERPRSEPRPARDSPAGARLLATQMAVSGSSRQEIASRLRNGFGIEDTDAVLDAILGPED
jgi:cell division septum initiation protein DivIVA